MFGPCEGCGGGAYGRNGGAGAGDGAPWRLLFMGWGQVASSGGGSALCSESPFYLGPYSRKGSLCLASWVLSLPTGSCLVAKSPVRVIGVVHSGEGET